MASKKSMAPSSWRICQFKNWQKHIKCDKVMAPQNRGGGGVLQKTLNRTSHNLL
jgi:hypothetical protein